MSKRGKPSRQGPPARKTAGVRSHTDFEEVLRLIESARTRAVAAVNTTLIDLYWNIGEYISQRIEADGWGQGPAAKKQTKKERR